MATERVVATYFIETALPLAAAAEALAGEQSSGTFVAVPGETDELRERFRARLESLEELESVAVPSLPGSQAPAGAAAYRRARIEISFALENMGTNLPTLVATVTDNDGQFLLIEACEAIPRWIKPDNAAHRVHLAGGQLHGPEAADAAAGAPGAAGAGHSLPHGVRVPINF